MAARLVRDLVRVRAHRAPPAVRSAAAAGWSRRWWGMLAVAVQQAVASTALGLRVAGPTAPEQAGRAAAGERARPRASCAAEPTPSERRVGQHR